MTRQNTVPRMAPAPAEQVRALLGMPAAVQSDPDGPLSHMVGQPVINILGVLGNHPALLSGVNPMLSALGQGKLTLRDRELMVLRVGYVLQSHYEWAHHVAIGSKAGLTEEEIARVPAGPDAPGWSEHDAALLRAVDELRGPEARLSDRTWQQLSSAYDAQQMLEVLAIVGAYSMLAYILKSCDVAIDDWLTDPADLPRPQGE
ncbi:carboxymuconolactone decarboxylase family protein [Streptomyces coffeae]|uniref:Carboxymuconolactone decarboxylase family protein n=1 Tax=Streptomyces coffeae TaxID=621382 RepID=A0ABS1N7C1_9ACTN|nr:carboxymuconolactone decarboxylase family protein [Streptomyces coffeae]MBL1095975.1 carboxymuconolactone decarboxylase family protein [Streptomyces coffeae]